MKKSGFDKIKIYQDVLDRLKLRHYRSTPPPPLTPPLPYTGWEH